MRSASSRAYGLLVNTSILNLPATPDTAVRNPDAIVDQTLGPAGVSVLAVDASRSITSTSSTASASSEVAGVSVNLGAVSVSASTLYVRAQSTSNSAGTTNSSAGSYIQNLVVNGTTYVDVRDRLIIPITVAGIAVGEVRTLDTSSGSSYAINGLRIRVFDLAATPVLNEAAEVIISHAEAASSFCIGPS